MAPKPEPRDPQSSDHSEWAARADFETRQAHPHHYLGHRPDGGQPRFYWDNLEVSEEEFRAGATGADLEILGMN